MPLHNNRGWKPLQLIRGLGNLAYRAEARLGNLAPALVGAVFNRDYSTQEQFKTVSSRDARLKSTPTNDYRGSKPLQQFRGRGNIAYRMAGHSSPATLKINESFGMKNVIAQRL